jgi:hypothetical protein
MKSLKDFINIVDEAVLRSSDGKPVTDGSGKVVGTGSTTPEERVAAQAEVDKPAAPATAPTNSATSVAQTPGAVNPALQPAPLKPPSAGASADGNAGELAAQANASAAPAQAGQPVNRDSMTFGQAFKDARNKKEPKFTWKGKEYTTQLAPSGDSATAQGITNAPAGAKDKVSLPNPGTKAIQHYLNTKYGQNLTVDGKDGPQTSAAIRSLSNKVSTDEYANIAGLAYAYNVLPGQGTGTVSLGNPEFTKRMAALGYDPKTGNPVSGGKSSAGTGQGTPAQAGMTAPAAQEPANASELRTKRDAYGKAYVAMKNNPATSPQALAQMEKNLTDIGAQMKAAGISESQTIGYAEDQNLVSIIHLAGLR